MIYIIFFVLCIPVTVTVFYMVKYRNPYTLTFIFGKKGTGKSTTLTMLAFKYKKLGWNVYCTEDIPFARKFDARNFGLYRFPPNSCILCDEVSLLWGNRDYQKFAKSTEAQFRLMRHDRLKIYLFSQTFDVDKKIRDLADNMYLATKWFNCICWLKKIDKSVVLTKSDSQAQSRIAEDLRFESIFLWPFGTRIAVWIPRWAKYFDSFADLQDQRAEIPYQDPLPSPTLAHFSLLSRIRKLPSEIQNESRDSDSSPD